jgi:hypothetical protein
VQFLYEGSRTGEVIMDNQPTQEMINDWHRYFAIECNNLAWDLASQPSRTSEETQKMLYSAYAAAFHWSIIGKPINAARADVALAHTHALAGQGEQALGYARRCLEFFKSQPAEDWDIAFAYAEMALASSTLGNNELHRDYYQKAQSLGEAITDAEDRKIFMEELARIPKPD